jgi:hypothetical protein
MALLDDGKRAYAVEPSWENPFGFDARLAEAPEFRRNPLTATRIGRSYGGMRLTFFTAGIDYHAMVPRLFFAERAKPLLVDVL